MKSIFWLWWAVMGRSGSSYSSSYIFMDQSNYIILLQAIAVLVVVLAPSDLQNKPGLYIDDRLCTYKYSRSQTSANVKMCEDIQLYDLVNTNSP